MSDVVALADELITEIDMSHAFKTWLIIEGYSDEKLFISRHLNNEVKTVVAFGWENVTSIVDGCASFPNKKVIGLVDRDYRDLRGGHSVNPNIVCTDYRDIENVLFETNALEKVYAEMGSIKKMPLTSLGKLDINKIRKELSQLAEKIGLFRAYCFAHQHQIIFDKLDHIKFINDKDLSLDVKKFIMHLRGNPDNAGKMNSINWSTTQANWIPQPLAQPEMVRHGHDLMAIIAISLRKKWATKGGAVSREDVEGLFRLASELAELQKFRFWQQLEVLLA